MPVIKRYSNRKLYDTEARQYVTLDDIAEMVQRGEDIQVVDHASGADLTTMILLQVIIEQEKRTGGLLSHAVLTNLVQAGTSKLFTLRDGVKAFMDPVVFIEDEIRRRLEKLVSTGRLSKVEADHFAELMLDPDLRPAPEEEPQAPGPVEAEADPQMVNSLLKQIEDLEKQIAELEK
jgi:polyhydroxyalkanoate synthesis repressor PhaR